MDSSDDPVRSGEAATTARVKARPSNTALRKKLLSGKPLQFDPGIPEEERTIRAKWLEEAAQKSVRIDVRNAVVEGALSLKYTTFEEEVSLIACDLKEPADFSYTKFKYNLDLTNTMFRQDTQFKSAIFEYDALLDEAKFLAGEASFIDLHVRGLFSAQRTHFVCEKVKFNRARFDQSVIFAGSIFEGEVDFESVRIGDQAECPGAVFKKNVSFNAAKIDGSTFFCADPPRNLPAASFEGEADFISVQIGVVGEFDGVLFRQNVSFGRAQIAQTAFFRGSTFEGKADFGSVRIGDQASFQGAVFKQNVTFSAAKIGGSAFFRAEPARNLVAATFEGEADFTGTQIGTTGEFQGVAFKQNVSFNGAQIAQTAFFPSSTFGGEANFASVHIGGVANFQGAVFKAKANFNSAKIDGSAFFRHTSFRQATSFERAEIWGAAIFRNAHFLKGSQPSFLGAQFKQGAFFQAATFEDEVAFRTAQFDVEARFHGATFSKKVNFDASHFTGLAQFSIGEDLLGAVFNQVSFDHARFERDARFHDAVFQSDVSFRETLFRVVYFSPTGKVDDQEQFQGDIDLRGCTYERIQVNWRLLLRRRDGTQRLQPYDRQPYTQLEKVSRAVGEDRHADQVYLERRGVERKQKRQRGEYEAWLGDMIYALLANYGVRPYRLIFIPLVLLLLGTAFFSLPATVSPKEKNVVCGSGDPMRLSAWQAFAVSLHQFLPVDVPMGSHCVPSPGPVEVSIAPQWKWHFTMRPSTFATFFLRLPGWILVPLGIAALTGLLRRVAP